MTPAACGERPFFRGWRARGDRPAIASESGLTLSYTELADRADELAREVLTEGRRSLGFVFAEQGVEPLAAYLGALRAGRPVALLHDRLSRARREDLVRTYEPDWILAPQPQLEAWRELGYDAKLDLGGSAVLVARERPGRPEPHPDLRLLLSTSGSTGGGKMVRLSEVNLRSNAASIERYMELDSDHRALLTLPMHYCFGLSVVHSHLAAGASILLPQSSFVQPTFWRFAEERGANVLAGVPFHFETWRRLGLAKLAALPLRILAQAGGALDLEQQEAYRAFAEERSARFFVMYGQSEATARISYVPPDALAENLGSIGVPIPGGEMSLDPETGEILYEGPNVMMGYATTAEDLALGDTLGGVLRTGDVGTVSGGLFRIVGRLARFTKVFGERVSLDELERDLGATVGRPVACTGADDRLVVAVESQSFESGRAVAEIESLLRERYHLRPMGTHVRHLPELPRLVSGKTDYVRLGEMSLSDA